MSDSFWHLDATELARLIRERQISAGETVAAALGRAESLGWLGSFASQRAERALAEAAAVDALPPGERPPLAGVPFAIKDWKCTVAGEPMWWGTRLLRDAGHVATITTDLATRYVRSGLVTIGRTALPELAFGPPTTEPEAGGPTLNPWHTDFSVGGSSGGSAAAVAAGIVSIANGSDGGGSLRIPAACCGLVGLKVSRGRLTNAPHADGRAIKVEGHVARTVRDVALLLDLTAGAAAGDDGTRLGFDGSFVAAIATPPVRLRIGVMTDAPGAMNPDGAPHPDHVTAVHEVAARLAGLGHDVVEAHPPGLDLPLRTPNLYAAERAVLRATLESIIGREITADDVEPRTWAMFELAGRADGVRVLEEIDREQRWARDVRRWWTDGFDLLLTPTLGRDVPRIGELKETAADPLGASIRGYPMAWFTYPFNITGQPAITVPVDWSTPVPTGVQMVGAMGREDVLLALAAALEQEYRWHDRWAPLADHGGPAPGGAGW